MIAHRRKSRGFTLLEVLVSLAILATSFVILLENVASSITLSGISRDMTVAAMLAQSKMTDFELEGQWTYGEQVGDFEETYPGFWWAVDVSDAPITALLDVGFNVLQIDLVIFWGDENAPQHLAITNFVTGEAEAAPVDQQDSDDDDTSGNDDTSDTTTKTTGSSS